MYQDLSTRLDWPVKKGIVDLLIRLKGISKCTSKNSLSPLGVHNHNIGAALQMLLKVMLHETIRKDDFLPNAAWQCWNSVVTIRNNVATMLQRCVALKIVVANRPV